jgi:hypothetical protein
MTNSPISAIANLSPRSTLGMARALALFEGIALVDAKGRSKGLDGVALDDLLSGSAEALVEFATSKRADRIVAHLEARGFRAVRGSAIVEDFSAIVEETVEEMSDEEIDAQAQRASLQFNEED